MNYFEEYISQLERLRKGEQTKVNVHLIVSEPLTSFCFDVNKKIKKHTVGFINMGVESIIVPHISLHMGFVDSYEMLEQIFTSVYLYAKDMVPFTVNPTCMYFKSISPTANQYLFIDLLQNDFLMEQKKILSQQLGQIVYPLGWNITEERAHITVGCYKHLTQSVHEMVNTYNMIPPCKISQIGVSFAGKYGVCLSLLKAFDL